MSTRLQITCHCGNRIQPSEVLQQGKFLRLYSPSFVYVKYRCSRCKRLGEQFVPEDRCVEPDIAEAATEVNLSGKESFSSLGAITLDEVVDFHFQMQNISLSELLRHLE